MCKCSYILIFSFKKTVKPKWKLQKRKQACGIGRLEQSLWEWSCSSWSCFLRAGIPLLLLRDFQSCWGWRHSDSPPTPLRIPGLCFRKEGEGRRGTVLCSLVFWHLHVWGWTALEVEASDFTHLGKRLRTGEEVFENRKERALKWNEGEVSGGVEGNSRGSQKSNYENRSQNSRGCSTVKELLSKILKRV